MAAVTVWVLTRDLFYYSKLAATAEKFGAQMSRFTDVSALPSTAADAPVLAVLDLGLVDVNSADDTERIRIAAAHPQMTLVGFYSHVQTQLKERAREMGCVDVWPKSAFADRFPEILRRFLPPSAPAS